MVTLESVVAVIAAYAKQSRGRLEKPIGPDTKMFQDGLIDSFGFVELLAQLEKISGQVFPEGELTPDDFESPRILYARLKELVG
jgi:acyl carrier protein